MSSMARKATTARTSKINRATPDTPSGIERYCRGLEDWPRSWMGWEKDLPPGEQLVARFRPFLEYLVCSGLAPKTLQKHVDNLCSMASIPKNNSAPSTPPAESSTVFSANLRNEPSQITHRL